MNTIPGPQLALVDVNITVCQQTGFVHFDVNARPFSKYWPMSQVFIVLRFSWKWIAFTFMKSFMHSVLIAFYRHVPAIGSPNYLLFYNLLIEYVYYSDKAAPTILNLPSHSNTTTKIIQTIYQKPFQVDE